MAEGSGSYSIGSVLTLPDNLVKAMDKVDDALDSMQKKAESTAKAISDAFDAAAAKGGFANFSKAVLDTASQFDRLAQSAQGAAASVGSIPESGNKGISEIGSSATASAESVTKLTAAIEAMTTAFDGKSLTGWAEEIAKAMKNQEETKNMLEQNQKLRKKLEAMSKGEGGNSGGDDEREKFTLDNLGSIKTIGDLKNAMKDLKSSMLGVDYDDISAVYEYNNALNALAATMKKVVSTSRDADVKNLGKSVEDEMKRLQRETELRQRNSKEEERAAKEESRRRLEAAKRARTENYNRNTTTQGALNFADTAGTMNRIKVAQEYLKIAMAKETDANSTELLKQKLEYLIEKEKEYNVTLKERNAKKSQISSVKSDASLFASDKTAFNATEYTELTQKLKDAQTVLKNSSGQLTESERKQTAVLIEGLKQRIALRNTENKISANGQITTQEAESYAAVAKSMNEMKLAMSTLEKARGNLSLIDPAQAQTAQRITDLLEGLRVKYNDATKSSEELAKAAQKAADAADAKAEHDAATKDADAAANYAAQAQTVGECGKALEYLNEVREKTNVSDTASLGKIKTAYEETKKKIDELTMSAEKYALVQERKGLSDANGNVTVTGAVGFAQNADTIEKMKRALQYLNEAKAGLSVSDTKGLTDIKTEVDRINESLKKLGMSQTEYEDHLRREAEAALKASEALAQYNEKKKFFSYDTGKYDTGELTNWTKTLNKGSSINERARAVKYLMDAIKALDSTDKNYAKTLKLMQKEMQRLQELNDNAIDAAKGMRGSHSKLLDTVGELSRAFALMFSLSQIKGYVEQIASVRGEFEMAQRSLQTLLGNKIQADEIFNKTVALAVQSPYKIKDLIQYTSQLAAYRIENDKLYDTTKRLADVSAGLGVDMQRIILAYGQVKAAAFLKGSEVRQFTEAGINIYSELQGYYAEVKDEAYSIAEIVDMISRRKVTFEDVEAIFQRMTDKGGMFYNMQLIQSETLHGKIMKMQDSIDVMLNKVGTKYESMMKAALDAATAIMDNWEAVLTVLSTVGTSVLLLSAAFGGLGAKILGVISAIGVHWIASGVTLAITVVLTLLSQYIAAQMNAAEEERKINDAYMNRMSILRKLEKQLDSINAKQSGGDVEATEAVEDTTDAVEEQTEAVEDTTDAVEEQTEAVEDTTDAVEEQTEAVEDTTDAVEEQTEAVESQTAALSESAEARGDETAGLNENTEAQDTNTRKRLAAQTFLEKAAQNAYVPAIDLNAVPDDKLDDAIQSEMERYEAFVRDMWRLQRDVNNNLRTRWGFWFDDIVEAAEDYQEAASTYVDTTTSIDTAVNFLKEAAKLASGETGEQLGKALSKANTPQGEDETALEYAKRRTDAIISVVDKFNRQLKSIRGEGTEQLQENLAAATTNVNDVRWRLFALAPKGQSRIKEAREYQELLRQFESTLAGTLDYAYKANEALGDEVVEKALKNRIDAIAATFQMGEYAVEAFYKMANERYGINIRPLVKESEIEDTADYIEIFLNNYLQEREFTISINSAQIGEDVMKDLYGYLDELGKNSSFAKLMVERLTRATAESFSKEELSKRGMITDKAWADIAHKVYGSVVEPNNITELDRKDVLAYYKEAVAEWDAIDARYGLSAKKDRGGSDKLMKERIRLLDEMNQRYEKYREIMSDMNASQATFNYYSDALAHVQMPRSVMDILQNFNGGKGGSTRGGIIGSLEMLLSMISDFDDKQDALTKVAELRLAINNETHERDLEKSKQIVEDAFSGLELYRTLKESGLGEADIKTMFPNIVTNYNEVKKAIEENFASKKGKKWTDAYEEQTKKLAEKQNDASIKEFAELVKEYKNAMSTRLQIDKWYWDEQAKMRTNEKFLAARPELQTEMQSNLASKYREKIDDAVWEEFRNSDYYTRIFDNLEGTSTRMLNAMSERLKSLRENLQNLSPAQVEKIIDAQNKLDEMSVNRNPFKTLKSGLTDYIKNLKKRKELEDEIAGNNKSIENFDTQIRGQSEIVNEKKQAWDDAVEQSGVESKAATEAKSVYEEQYKILEEILKKKKEISDETDEQVKSLNQIITLNENTKTALTKVGNYFGDAADIINSTFDALEDWGLNIEMPDWMEEISEGFSKIDSALSELVSGKVISGTINLIGGIGKTLGGIFGWGTKDNRLQKRIEKLIDAVDDLEKAFEKMEESMTSALSYSTVYSNYESGIANLKSQIADYEQMIEYEKDKKDTDDDQIEEWEDTIADLYEQLEDYTNSYLEMLGGISTDDYRSAAEEFAEAWIDAFNETEDTFEALTDNLQDYLDNMLKQMVTNAASSKFLEPIFDNLNALVEEAGDITQLSKSDLDTWIEESEDYLEQYNDFLETYFEKLGISPSSADSDLSALQQGIQSITEETGAALESLLNSMRFYLATQQADVAIIRATLVSMANGGVTSESSSTPMITELKAQTELLRSIDNRLSSVIKMGHPNGGKGLKVFMD